MHELTYALQNFIIMASFQDNRNDDNKSTNFQYCECLDWESGAT